MATVSEEYSDFVDEHAAGAVKPNEEEEGEDGPQTPEQAEFYKFVCAKIVYSDDESQWRQYFFLSHIEETWDAIEAKPSKFTSYEEQEKIEDSSFRRDVSGFSLSHLDGAILARLGRVVTSDPTNKLFNCMVVWEPLVAPGSTKKARMEAVGSQYNGVLFNPEKKSIDVFRYDLDSQGNRIPVIMGAQEARKHFAFTLENLPLAKAIAETKNKRQAKVMLPYGDEGVQLTLTIPYVPSSLMRVLRKFATDGTLEKIENKAKAPKLPSVKKTLPKIEKPKIEIPKPAKGAVEASDDDASESSESASDEAVLRAAAAKEAKPLKVAKLPVAKKVAPPKKVVPPKKPSPKRKIDEALEQASAEAPAAAPKPAPKRLMVDKCVGQEFSVDELIKYFCTVRANLRAENPDSPVSMAGIINHIKVCMAGINPANPNKVFTPPRSHLEGLTMREAFDQRRHPEAYAEVMTLVGAIKVLAPYLYDTSAALVIPDSMPECGDYKHF